MSTPPSHAVDVQTKIHATSSVPKLRMWSLLQFVIFLEPTRYKNLGRWRAAQNRTPPFHAVDVQTKAGPPRLC